MTDARELLAALRDDADRAYIPAAMRPRLREAADFIESALSRLSEIEALREAEMELHEGYDPCPTCHQYSHSIADRGRPAKMDLERARRFGEAHRLGSIAIYGLANVLAKNRREYHDRIAAAIRNLGAEDEG